MLSLLRRNGQFRRLFSAHVVSRAGDAFNTVAIVVLAFVLSAGAMVFNPAAASLLPDIVDTDDLVTANSALWSAAVIVQIALAPAAGLVIAASGVRTAFAVNALTFVVSALALRGLRPSVSPSPRTRQPAAPLGADLLSS